MLCVHVTVAEKLNLPFVVTCRSWCTTGVRTEPRHKLFHEPPVSVPAICDLGEPELETIKLTVTMTSNNCSLSHYDQQQLHYD